VRSAALLTLALATGCGSSATPVPLEEFSQAAQSALCDWAVRCRHMPDRAACERLIDPKGYDTRRAEDAVAAGRMGWNANAAGRCVEATREAFCTAAPFSDASCGEYLVGLVAEGGACTSDYECQGGAACEDAVCGVQCCVGACGAPPTITIDPPSRAAIGEPCDSHADCVVEAYCEEDGVCTPMPDEEGDRCLFGCAPGDLYCDVDALQCRAYAGMGESCDLAGLAAPPCNRAYSYCDGACVARPGAGEPCDSDVRLCIPSLYCDASGTCRERNAAGAACADADQCQDVCDQEGGQCVAYESCETE